MIATVTRILMETDCCVNVASEETFSKMRRCSGCWHIICDIHNTLCINNAVYVYADNVVITKFALIL